jgi:hypothetical protein
MNDEAQGLKNALRQNVPLSDEFGDKTYYILITIDLAEQKAVGVKFCETQELNSVKTIQIPIDERTGKPLVSSAMKAECIGGFRFTRQNACVQCYDEADANCDVCGGEIDYIETITVPWDTCKEIYKAMTVSAGKETHNAELTRPVTEPSCAALLNGSR